MDPLQFATQLAQDTGEVLRQYYQPTGISAKLKSDRTVVTEADLAADSYLQNTINKSYPEDCILSEEAGTIYPAKKSAVWIIDPLDGTTNFSLGLHYWGVSIARIVDNQPETAALFFPLLNELFTAQRGRGAFFNGQPLKIKTPDLSMPNTFFSCCSRAHKRYHIDIPYKTRIFGSATYDICSVARGSSILAFITTPKIWDLAAGWIVVEEAGGIILNMDRADVFPLQPNVDYQQKSYPLLVAATSQLAKKGIEKIRKRIK
jgi:myo-inositol-1(or 4)-monophosphatase